MTTATPNTKTIHELSNHDGPIYIKNNTPTRITCRDNLGEHKIDFELDPAGGPDSVQMIPKIALKVRGIQKLMMTNKVSVGTDESFQDQITELLGQAVGVPQDALDEIMGAKSTVTSNNMANSLVEKPCLQCGIVDPETKVIERGRVLQSASDAKDGTPPLCDDHTNLAYLFLARPVSNSNGEQTWEFDKVSGG